MAILKTLTTPRLPIVQLEPFTPTAFAPFGTCIEAPLTTRAGNRPEQACGTADAIVANQGTARKYARVSAIRDFYPATDPPASQQLHVFSCAPRTLPRSGVFAVRILERHPFTTQTFVPLAVDDDDDDAYFVVIVAPTATDGDAGWPDLRRLRAFRARPGQAVTYNAGTWHAPMVVLRARVDFVVVVAENGTARDCEEVEIVAADGDADGGVGVKVVDDGNWGLWAEGKRMRNGKARL